LWYFFGDGFVDGLNFNYSNVCCSGSVQLWALCSRPLILSQDDLTSLEQGDQSYVTSLHRASSATYNTTYSVAWSSFELSDDLLGSQQVIFSVTNTDSNGRFVTVLADIGGGWDSLQSWFVVPVTGIYVLSFSGIASNSDGNIIAQLLQDYGLHTFLIKDIKSISIGQVQRNMCSFTVSRSVVIELKLLRRIYVRYSNLRSTQINSFKGFLYAPAKYNVSWSMSEEERDVTLSSSYDVQFTTSDLLSQIRFTNANKTHLSIPHNGVYYVAVTIQCNSLQHIVFTNDEAGISAMLYADGRKLLQTPPVKGGIDDCNAHQRALLVPLQQGVALSVKRLQGIVKGKAIPSSISVNFCGFLVCFT
jgi:hypothetical protein